MTPQFAHLFIGRGRSPPHWKEKKVLLSPLCDISSFQIFLSHTSAMLNGPLLVSVHAE